MGVRYEEKPAGFPSSAGRLRRRACSFSAVGIIEMALRGPQRIPKKGWEGVRDGCPVDPASPPRQRSGEVEAVNFAQGLQVMAE